MKTFIVQLKDTHLSDFNLLAIVEANNPLDAICKLSLVNEFDPGLTDEYQVYQLDELTNLFYDDH
ncbi:hypothetical protein LCGC14_1633390 [marine sediment metagenome]|uniref:Uncharacterized protein n=1 Tax=marine sediment metagenome TaxID=412755 RepID=A0A0F9KHK5_9ZZZZ